MSGDVKKPGGDVVHVDFLAKRKIDGTGEIPDSKRELNIHEKQELQNLDTFLMALSTIEGDIDYARDIRNSFRVGSGVAFSILCSPVEMSEWDVLFRIFSDVVDGKGGTTLDDIIEKLKIFAFKIKDKFES